MNGSQSLESRLAVLRAQVEPHGCVVVDESIDPEDGLLTLGGEYSPLLDIPDGYLVEGPAHALPMREHRALMGLDSGLDVTSVWGLLARVANRYQASNDRGGGNGREVCLLVSLPKVKPEQAASVGPFCGRRRPGPVKKSEMTAEGMRSAAVDILSSIAQWRADLGDEVLSSDVEMYLSRNQADGEPLQVHPWEKAIPSARGGEAVMAVPRAAFDDALAQALEQARARRLAYRVESGLVPARLELEGELGSVRNADGQFVRRKFQALVRTDDVGSIVSIFDRTHETSASPFGQFVTSYYCSTLAERHAQHQQQGERFSGGFALDGGVPDWSLSGASYHRLCEWAALHHEAHLARMSQGAGQGESVEGRPRMR